MKKRVRNRTRIRCWKKEIKKGFYITLDEAVKVTKATRRAIDHWISDGILQAYKCPDLDARTTYVKATDLRRFMKKDGYVRWQAPEAVLYARFRIGHLTFEDVCKHMETAHNAVLTCRWKEAVPHLDKVLTYAKCQTKIRRDEAKPNASN